MTMPQSSAQTTSDDIDFSAFSRGLWIDGKWRAASSGASVNVTDPSTENTITTVPDATVEDAMSAVEAAAAAAVAGTV